jgi:hypothetical protein
LWIDGIELAGALQIGVAVQHRLPPFGVALEPQTFGHLDATLSDPAVEIVIRPRAESFQQMEVICECDPKMLVRLVPLALLE